MTKSLTVLALGATLLAASVPTFAAAQTQTRLPGSFFDPSREAPPLTVRKRPFTDSGTAVQTGYEHEYLTEQTILNRPVYSSFNPDRYGQDVLPHPFDGLGLP